MSSDVFISHSNKDKNIAEAICHQLETGGIRCWIAPRDIEFGADWTAGITQGIASCKVFVLVFSDSANTSDHVRREVAKAFSLGLAVIPFRTEDVAPNRSLSYFLETVHWLDAFPVPENYFGALADQIKRLLAQPTSTDSGTQPGQPEIAAVKAPPVTPPPSDLSRHSPAGAGETRRAPLSPAAPGPKKRFGDPTRALVRFNLIFLPILIAAVGGAAAVVHGQLSQIAQQQIVGMAQVMLETARASRKYTTEQIAPLLERLQTSGEQFHPQSIPFFAATEAFNYFRQAHPDFAYKEAALNPTNPRDRTVDWEADIVSELDDASCLECHSTPDKAPAGMVKLYGSANGFGWKSGDIVGAQIVSVPAALTEQIASNAYRSILWWLIGIAIVVFGLANGVLYWALRSAGRRE
jgi:hypothetical protein